LKSRDGFFNRDTLFLIRPGDAAWAMACSFPYDQTTLVTRLSLAKHEILAFEASSKGRDSMGVSK